MAADLSELRVQPAAGGYTLVGPESAIEVVNEFLCYLVDRNYSRQTVRAYAFDLLHFLRWLSVDGLALEAVNTDALLCYLTACRTTLLPCQQGDKRLLDPRWSQQRLCRADDQPAAGYALGAV